jgi:hypothetical protein
MLIISIASVICLILLIGALAEFAEWCGGDCGHDPVVHPDCFGIGSGGAGSASGNDVEPD